MKIALLGYGKMGKEVKELTAERPDLGEVVHTVDLDSLDRLSDLAPAEVAIEFSIPQAAFDNIKACFAQHLPVVSGTTGWLDRYEEACELCRQQNGTFLYASNFSVGVNLLFALNKQLASLMEPLSQYDLALSELHHIEKLDAPSGTAIRLAEDALARLSRKKQWTGAASENPEDLIIHSKREGNAPGTHTIQYSSDVDRLEITHVAMSRRGFASGALMAAQWLCGKTGCYTMKDVLNLDP